MDKFPAGFSSYLRLPRNCIPQLSSIITALQEFLAFFFSIINPFYIIYPSWCICCNPVSSFICVHLVNLRILTLRASSAGNTKTHTQADCESRAFVRDWPTHYSPGRSSTSGLSLFFGPHLLPVSMPQMHSPFFFYSQRLWRPALYRYLQQR